MSFVSKFYKNLSGCNIIMAHHVRSEKSELCPCVINEENFLSFIENKKFVDVKNAIKHPIKYKNCYVLTVDDALSDLYTTIYRICKEKGIPFTAFISSDLLDKEGYITTGQLKEMSKNPLVTIGSHGATHKLLSKCGDDESKYEIFSSKNSLENILSKKVDFYAYSNGAFTQRDVKLLKSAKYKYAFGVTPRKHTIITKLFYKYNLPRYNLSNDTFNKGN